MISVNRVLLKLGFTASILISQPVVSVERVSLDMGFTEGSGTIELYLNDLSTANQTIFTKGKKTNHNVKSYQILDQYYHYLGDDNKDGLMSILATSDNTQTRIAEFLQANPNAYEGYSELEKVSSDLTILWGTYNVHSISLESKQGEKTAWREVTQCLSGCVVSNMLDQMDIADQLFIESVEYLKYEAETRPLTPGRRSDFENAINIFPAGFTSYQNVSQYPMRMFFEPQPISLGVVNFNEECGNVKYEDVDVAATIAVLCEIKNADLTKTNAAQLLAKIGIQVEEKTEVPVIKRVTSEENAEFMAEKVGEKKTLPVYQTVLGLEDFVKIVRTWDGIQVLSKAFRNQRGLIFFRPVTDEANAYQAVQSMGLIRRGKRRQILIVPEFALGQLPVSAFVAAHLDNKYPKPES